MSLTLVIGNKNYSSWSLRPWIAMKVASIPFEEIQIPLYEPGSRERMLEYSPAGKVPILIDGDEHVWESLAILEHLAERFPEARLWPSDRRARSHARAIASEMHGGFQPLRQNCTMNMWLPVKARPQPPEVLANVARIEQMWADCRARFGQSGPFLFGAFGAADAMYAPVVARFNTYGLPVSAKTRAYMDAVMGLPAWREWYDAAMQETWIMQHNEPDWPLVRGKPVG
ncbi:MAG TPA: glutathione S-transferase family protein [Pseudolabrys sp.]|uniref:glutathione S-transferase family protein n=1 Tax=Pseudolabrys sp. TaxID=1960880 RepID=UPI002DDCB6B9|nr:glutathione S-transferase family protein [Pseudolabrys sp.]HEV2627845.1 glutathione S-transferase family protein [Pseudolabrys sp.]